MPRKIMIALGFIGTMAAATATPSGHTMGQGRAQRAIQVLSRVMINIIWGNWQSWERV